MTYSPVQIWFVILALGAGTFLMRYSFLAMIGDRKLPEWLLRHLRYTAVAVLPGLVAPAILWPQATGGEFDIPRAGAAAVTVIVGMATRHTVASMVAGIVSLYTLLAVFG